jgi:ADP-ribosylglycohydrolase
LAGHEGPGNNGGFAPDVLRAAVYCVGTSGCFAETLERSLAFAGPSNYCPVLVGAIAGSRYFGVMAGWLVVFHLHRPIEMASRVTET